MTDRIRQLYMVEKEKEIRNLTRTQLIGYAWSE